MIFLVLLFLFCFDDFVFIWPLAPSSKDMLQRNHRICSSVEIKSHSHFNNLPSVLFSDEEIDSFAQPLAFSLVGKFPKGRPSLEKIKEHFTGFKLHCSVSIVILNNRYILIRLLCIEDYTRIFAKRFFFIDGLHIRILKWSPNVDFSEESPMIPIWIAFPLNRIHLFNPTALLSLGAIFGTPLQIDPTTIKLACPSIARVLFEMNVSNKHEDRIWIESKEKGYIQSVVFENLPKYYSFCIILGHVKEECRKCDSNKEKSIGKADNVEMHNSLDQFPQAQHSFSADNAAPAMNIADKDNLHINLEHDQNENAEITLPDKRTPEHIADGETVKNDLYTSMQNHQMQRLTHNNDAETQDNGDYNSRFIFGPKKEVSRDVNSLANYSQLNNTLVAEK